MTDGLEQMSLRTEALKTQMQDLDRLAEGVGNRLVSAFADAAIRGQSLSDVLKGLALSLSRMALSMALRPLGSMLGSLVPNAVGNVIAKGQVVPFADGGIVNSPVLFPMRGGTGLMGEAGSEAIMPLARGSDGKLGVRGGAGGARVTINIQTPDVAGFQQSQGQVAAMIARAVSRGQRNL